MKRLGLPVMLLTLLSAPVGAQITPALTITDFPCFPFVKTQIPYCSCVWQFRDSSQGGQYDNPTSNAQSCTRDCQRVCKGRGATCTDRFYFKAGRNPCPNPIQCPPGRSGLEHVEVKTCP
jgi:hypothetical protein